MEYMDFNLAQVFESISSAIGGRPCFVTPSRTLSYAAVEARSGRLADYLVERGLGQNIRERETLHNWESGQDHLGIMLYNSPEYMEAMLACFKARVAPFNINYRYTVAELAYLLRDARPRGLVYPTGLADRVAAAIDEAAVAVEVLIEVTDGADGVALPGAASYDGIVSRPGNTSTRGALRLSPEDLSILYTGGTTGLPKGVLWAQGDSVVAQWAGRDRDGREYTSVDQIVARAAKGARASLPGNPFMHGGGQIWVIQKWLRGGTIHLPADTKSFDAADVWRTIERGQVQEISIVGDGFAVPLLDELDAHARHYDLSAVTTLYNGGAPISARSVSRFFAHLPQAKIVNAIGSSESGPMASAVSAKDDARVETFQGGPDSVVLNEARTGIFTEGSAEIGWLARKGRLAYGYLNHPAETAETYPVIDGIRYVVLGDRARVRPGGGIEFIGRSDAIINTGGEKVFADEVAGVLRGHEAVLDALVLGRPHPRWGSEVCAIVQLVPGRQVTSGELVDYCRTELSGYKVPRCIEFVEGFQVTPIGKIDLNWARSLIAVADRDRV
jgi:3-oxocholest-4-en-26-oate---CoA ligase